MSRRTRIAMAFAGALAASVATESNAQNTDKNAQGMKRIFTVHSLLCVNPSTKSQIHIDIFVDEEKGLANKQNLNALGNAIRDRVLPIIHNAWTDAAEKFPHDMMAMNNKGTNAVAFAQKIITDETAELSKKLEIPLTAETFLDALVIDQNRSCRKYKLPVLEQKL